MNLNEKTAFLKGLMEGMNFDTTTNEGKLLAKLVEIVDDIAHEIEYLDEKTDVQSDYLEELDHDLGEVEEYVYECDEDDDDFDCDECECYDEDDDACLCEDICDECEWDDGDCDCGCCSGCEDDEDDEDGDFEDDLYEIECPNCHDKIYASEDMLKDSLLCPNCNEKLCDIEIED